MDDRTKRRKALRLPGYDYTTPGAYFITVCTEIRECILGPDPIPAIIRAAWRLTAARGGTVPEWDFVVMPNHVHGIVHLPSGPQTSLRDIMRSFKSFATRSVNNFRGMRGTKLWQANYWERVVRSDRELERFRQYILDNPSKWEDDPLNPASSQNASPGTFLPSLTRAP